MSRAMGKARRYYRYSLGKVEDYLGDRVVEVGCGWGIYTKLMIEKGRTVLANEIDEECLEYCRSEFKGDRVSFIHGDINQPDCHEIIAEFKPDSILMMQVLEHVRDDLKLLETLAGLSQPCTRLILFVPAFPSLYGPMDREAGHFRRYTRNSLGKCVSQAGWSVIDSSYCNPIGGIGWWINNRLLSRWTKLNADHINSQIVFFDKFVLPLSKLLDPLTKKLFGQGLVLIATKS